MDELTKAQDRLDNAVVALAKPNQNPLDVLRLGNEYIVARDAFRDAAMRYHATMGATTSEAR